MNKIENLTKQISRIKLFIAWNIETSPNITKIGV